MLAFARYFVEQAKANDMGTFYWMGLSDGAHRSVPEFNQTDLKDAIIKGYYGDDGYSSITSSKSNQHPSITGYYNLYGQPSHALQRGINIITMSDGTSRKVIK